MPTALRILKYRFFFYSHENMEPPHIHIESAENYCKFWLDDVTLASSVGFSSKELNEIRKLVQKHKNKLKGTWNDHFSIKTD